MRGLEIWINEVVAQKADGHNEAIPGFIREGFQRDLRANTVYHAAIAKRLTNDGDHALSRYHSLMAKIYTSLM